MDNRASRADRRVREPKPPSERLFNAPEDVELGGLLSYGPDIRELFRRAASYVDKVLRGANPKDLPVELPSRLELIVNRRTAKLLGLTIPQSLQVLKLRSDQTDSVSVDLHQQRLNGDGRLLSFGHTCGRLRRRKIKSRHSRILRHRRQSAIMHSCRL